MVKIHQAYLIQSALAYLPDLLESPNTLYKLLRPLALGTSPESGIDVGTRVIWARIYGAGGGRTGPFVRRLGPVSAPQSGKLYQYDQEGEELTGGWVLPKLDAPHTGRGHYPYLIQANWSFRLLNPPQDTPVFHLRPRLKLHLFPYGVVNALLCTEFFSKSGLDVTQFIHLTNTLSHVRRGGLPLVFEVAGGHWVGGTHPRYTTKQILSAAFDTLQQSLFEHHTPPAFLRENPGDAPLSTLLCLNRITPPDALQAHPKAACGLVTGEPRWQQIASRLADPYTTPDYGKYEGDYIKWGRLNSVICVRWPENRRYRHHLYWKLHSRIELARIEAFLYDLLADLLDRTPTNGLLDFADDLLGFAQQPLGGHRKVYRQAASLARVEQVRSTFIEKRRLFADRSPAAPDTSRAQIQQRIEEKRIYCDVLNARVEAVIRDLALELDGERKTVLQMRLDALEEDRRAVETELVSLQADLQRLRT
ncbi:MAG: hypothetical protein JXA89_24975 [Anaerolineae bacterium]|nr:hypothetical protein [Anaerolineae bacterium]